MNGFDPQTLDFYARGAADYVAVSRPEEPEAALCAFLSLLPAGAKILELGCGGGRDAAYMIAQGFDAEPTDGVAAMAAQAEARLGKPVRVMRFDQLEAVNAYDAVIANASLLHVPHADLPHILARVRRALRPSGWHFASYKTGKASGYDEHGRYYNYVSREEAQRFYGAAGDWQSLTFEEWMGTGYFSTPAKWLSVTGQSA